MSKIFCSHSTPLVLKQKYSHHFAVWKLESEKYQAGEGPYFLTPSGTGYFNYVMEQGEPIRPLSLWIDDFQ